MLTVINTKPFEKKKPNIRVKLILIISIIVGILLLSLFIQNIRFSFFGKKKLLLEPCRNPKCTVNENDRFDCHPEKHLTETKCKRRCCCWHGKNARVPCFFPSNYLGYVLQESVITEYGFSLTLKRHKPSPYPGDVLKLQMDVSFETETRLRIKIFDPVKKRFEVPFPVPKVKIRAKKPQYVFQTTPVGQLFHFNVSRIDPVKSKTSTILIRSSGTLVFADQFLQLSYFLPSNFIYGLGEHHGPLLHSTKWSKIPLWNKDHIPKDKLNIYGSHPFYQILEKNGKSHGVFLRNSNAMDIILQPSPAITWRPIGGIFDFYVFLGPTPADVVQQYTDIVGHPFMPPYWSLGFHLCRFGYPTANKTLSIMNRVRAAGIPQDVQWSDIDYAYKRRDFTFDSKKFGDLPGMVQEIHNRGMKYVLIIDPGIYAGPNKKSYIPYSLGMDMGIFINDSSGTKPLVGKVWPGITVFPDFTNPKTTKYWHILISKFQQRVKFDGLWLDMNEISNFVTGSIHGCPEHSQLENPPYVPGIRGKVLRFATICTSAKQYLSTQYNLHNLYGLTETMVSYKVLAKIWNRRPFLISRSTFSGSGHYGGHWTGDNRAIATDMKASIADMINFNIFGIPMIGADICGFHLNTSQVLCQRWYQLGAFYPFSRSHNSLHLKDQDPAAFGKAFAESTRKAYLTRYSLLPYLYTLFYRSHVNGSTVVRPLFYEFPLDKNTYALDTQFLWGPALMFSPVLVPNELSVMAYFPRDIWYNFYTGKTVPSTSGYHVLEAPLDVINIHLRGGYILPLQDPELTTFRSRKNLFTLLVALNIKSKAKGEIYWDDGDSLDSVTNNKNNLISFHAEKDFVKNEVIHKNYLLEPMFLNNVTVFGLQSKPKAVFFNRHPVFFFYKNETKVLYVTKLKASLLDPFKLTWFLG